MVPNTTDLDLSIIIPCYNEEDGIDVLRQKLVPAVRNLQKSRSVEVILVDDGSKDRTLELLHSLAKEVDFIRVVPHTVNQGLGAALRTGFASCRGKTVVTTDSDGTYSFDQIAKILEYLGPGVDVVTASPFRLENGFVGVPKWRLFLSRGASLIYELLLGKNILCYTAMFRAYRRECVDRVPFESNDFLGVAQFVVNALLMGYTVVEYPTVLTVRVTGVSKARIVRIIRSHLKFQLRVLLIRLGLFSLPASRQEQAS